MEKLLQKLIDLAKEWRDFSLMSRGRECMDYCDGAIWCYFADNPDHASVRFRMNQISFSWDTIDVAFHSPPQVSGFTVRSASKIEAGISKYYELLENEKSIFAKLSEEQVRAKNQETIDTLEERLADAKAAIKAAEEGK